MKRLVLNFFFVWLIAVWGSASFAWQHLYTCSGSGFGTASLYVSNLESGTPEPQYANWCGSSGCWSYYQGGGFGGAGGYCNGRAGHLDTYFFGSTTANIVGCSGSTCGYDGLGANYFYQGSGYIAIQPCWTGTYYTQYCHKVW